MMKNRLDDILMDYFASDKSPSADTIRSVREAIDCKEKENKKKQIYMVSAFSFVFSLLAFGCISIFISSALITAIAVSSFIFSALGSILFMFFTKKELIPEGDVI
jgi:hypothetical protein